MLNCKLYACDYSYYYSKKRSLIWDKLHQNNIEQTCLEQLSYLQLHLAASDSTYLFCTQIEVLRRNQSADSTASIPYTYQNERLNSPQE